MADGKLPLLMPMSEVAGRMATQVGAAYLEKHHGGRGVLLGGVPGVRAGQCRPSSAAASVGTNAAKVALGMGAQVTVLDINHDRLHYLDDVFQGRLQHAHQQRIQYRTSRLQRRPGDRRRVDPRRPRALAGDAQDAAAHAQGRRHRGCGRRPGRLYRDEPPTTHRNPTYIIDDIVHYCVANMPGAVPRTSTFALVNQTMSYVLSLANDGLDAVRTNRIRCTVSTRIRAI